MKTFIRCYIAGALFVLAFIFTYSLYGVYAGTYSPSQDVVKMTAFFAGAVACVLSAVILWND